jgi:tetratricopeptide (TPR) repeat protein
MKIREPAGSITIRLATPSHLLIHPRPDHGLITRMREEANKGLYREIIASNLVRELRTDLALKALGDRLLAMAEHSFTLRKLDAVERICLYMLSLPLEANHHSGAIYFYALCGKRRGKTAAAKAIFERLTEEATLRFRAKSFSSLAAIAMDEGDYNSSLELYIECARLTFRSPESTLGEVVQAHRALAVMKSRDGDHRGSLSYLEKVLPLAQAARSAHPHAYYDLLNSLAVELSEAGRMEEAQNASAVVVASVFAPAYPEFQETQEEIAEKSRRKSRSRAPAAVAMPSTPVNIVRLPAPDQSSIINVADQQKANRGRILSFQQWKKSLRKRAAEYSVGRLTQRHIENMSLPEKQVALMKLIFQEDVSEKTLTRLLTLMGELESEK